MRGNYLPCNVFGNLFHRPNASFCSARRFTPNAIWLMPFVALVDVTEADYFSLLPTSVYLSGFESTQFKPSRSQIDRNLSLLTGVTS